MSRVSSRVTRVMTLVGLTSMCLAAGVGASHAQWVVKSEDGKSSFKLGVLMQGRGEWGWVEDLDPVSQNLYIRRARVLIGGQINSRVGFFFETDSPSIGRVPRGESAKAYGGQYVQDFTATLSLNDQTMIDGGLLLVPTSYNHLQSAASFLTLDYGPFTFVESDPMQENVGRDMGLQARGLLGEKLAEYRVAILQGVRGKGDANPLRTTARISVHPFKTAGKGFFYTGTGFGKAKVLSLGAAADMQKDYSSFHGDIYFEAPVAAGSSVTLQGDFSMYDGGNFLPGLAKQNVLFAESGIGFMQNRMSLFGQIAMRDYESELMSDETHMQIGLGAYLDGHRSSVKLAIDRRSYDDPEGGKGAPSRTGLVLQYQIFHF